MCDGEVISYPFLLPSVSVTLKVDQSFQGKMRTPVCRRRSTAKMLMKDEVQHIAANFAAIA
jgi:hypothetical protein